MGAKVLCHHSIFTTDGSGARSSAVLSTHQKCWGSDPWTNMGSFCTSYSSLSCHLFRSHWGKGPLWWGQRSDVSRTQLLLDCMMVRQPLWWKDEERKLLGGPWQLHPSLTMHSPSAICQCRGSLESDWPHIHWSLGTCRVLWWFICKPRSLIWCPVQFLCYKHYLKVKDEPVD